MMEIPVLRTLVEILAEKAARTPSGSPDLQAALVSEILWLSEELCVARDRVDVAVRLSVQGPVSERAIDDYQPDEAEIERRLERHGSLYEALFQRLSQSAGRSGDE